MTGPSALKSIETQRPDFQAKTKSDAADRYQPTATEERVIGKLCEQLKAETPVPGLKKSKNTKSLSFQHPNQAMALALLMDALGTTSADFAGGVQYQLAQIGATNGEVNENNLNFALSVVTGIKPKDQTEAMLGVLKAASYLSAVKMASHLHNAQTTIETDTAERAFNKCARTFAMLSETLMRKRSGTEQKVAVHNVSVRDMHKRSSAM